LRQITEEVSFFRYGMTNIAHEASFERSLFSFQRSNKACAFYGSIRKQSRKISQNPKKAKRLNIGKFVPGVNPRENFGKTSP